VARPDGADAGALGELRAFVERFPRHAALKRIVQRRGVDMTGEVRRPLRQLTDDERIALDAWLDSLF
jgi:dihydrodipicolinate synthase/N-acetylneuraminate lyase